MHPIRFLNLLPLSHVFGQFLGIFIPQMLGSPVIFQNSLNPSEIMRTIKRERVSVLVTVPRVMEALRDKMLRDMKALGKLETFEREFAKADNEHFIMRWWRFRRIHSQLGWKFWAFIFSRPTATSEKPRLWHRTTTLIRQRSRMF